MSLGALKKTAKYGARTACLLPLLALSVIPFTSPALSVGLIDGNALHSIDGELTPIPGMPQNSHFCQIVLNQSGAFVPNVNRDIMASDFPGGRAGSANVSATNSSYRLYMDLPSNFDAAPMGGDSAVTFGGYFHGSGSTSFGKTPHTSFVRVKRGTTKVDTNFQITKDSGVFPGGNYSATLTLRCE